MPWFGGVEQDFLEVPSMMFELWMDKEYIINRYVLYELRAEYRRIAGHYRNREEKLDAETVKQMSKAQHFLESIGTKRVIGMSEIYLRF